MKLPQAGDTLIIATHNSGKVEEFQRLLSPHGINVTSAGALGLPEPEETETSFVGNARIKAHAAARATGQMALADDSGLEIDALDGAPGVFTADWAETPEGRDFNHAMARAHRELLACRAEHPWRARFCCTLVLASPDGSDLVFEGTAEGQLVWPPRGALGHGYDPMFVPAGSDKTFAELAAAEKDAISHRADALRKFIDTCFT